MKLKRCVLLTVGLFAMIQYAPIAAAEEASQRTIEERATLRAQIAAEAYKMGAYPVALEDAKRALAMDSNNVLGFMVMALSQFKMRDFDQAFQTFAKAQDVAPQSSDLQHNYGSALCEHGDYAKGLEKLNRALQLNVKTPDRTLVVAGQCALASGDVAKSEQFLARAIETNFQNADAKYQMARTLLAAQKLPEARVSLLESIKLSDQQPSAGMLWLGVKIERKLNNAEGEKRMADQLRTRYPDSLETARLLAGQYDK